MQTMVSIIIPIYNLEEYIKYCLDSIVMQSFKNLEIICIDDGSKDNTAEIIKQYASTDNRIKYFYQENSGVSSARNHGLKVADGKYIMFIDGDDYIHPRTVELLTKCAEETDADMVFSGFESVYSYDHKPNITSFPEPIKCDIEALYSQPSTTQPGESCWGKLIKKEIATSTNFRTDIQIGEDTLYIMSLVTKLQTVYFIDAKFYYYSHRNSSIYHSSYSLKNFSCVIAYDEICNFTYKSKSKVICDFGFRGIYRHICLNRMMAKHTPYEKKVFADCKKIGRKWLLPYFKSTSIKPIKKIAQIIFYFCPHIYKLARIIIDPTMKELLKNR